MTRYELLDRIGVGGMAEIFRGKAVAAGGFEKPVAIKRILPHLSQDRRFVELLIAEAKVLSLLKHRNIVQIFDVGLGDDGQYFLVMEFVDGKDLGAVQRALEAKRRRLPFDLALHVGAEICEALEHAHSARAPDGKPMSLVHRDVSPSNVLLSRAGEVKLTDFGIAKRAEQDATQGGAVRGKFAYISPEQARNEPLDPRADVFSVGVLLWELVCNRRLFSGMDDLAALRAVRDAQVPRPTEVDGRLPPEIDTILMTALARDASRRYATAGQLGTKLRSLRYSLEVTVGDPSSELAKIIESAEEVERLSQPQVAIRPSGPYDMDGGEATVIRIRTAEDFSARDNDASIVRARKVIDRFEEEETRLAQLSGDQLRVLREEPRRDSEEMTRMRAVGGLDEIPTPPSFPGGRDTPDLAPARDTPDFAAALDTPPHQRLTPSDETRLVAPRDRRTPVAAQRSVRPPTVPPTVPARARGPTPGPPLGGAPRRTPTTPPRGAPEPVPMRPLPPPDACAPAGPPGASPPGSMAPYPGPNPSASGSMPPYAGGPPPPGPGAPPFAPSPPAGAYPSWGAPIAPQLPPREATPTARDAFDRPVFDRPSVPQIAGFGGARRPTLQPWVLVVGAIVMALIAFAITRAFLG